jgi:hypothetical protein
MSVIWDLALKSAGLLVTALMTIYQVRALFNNSRTRLKTDLEILSLMGKDHQLYGAVKTQVDRALVQLYFPSPFQTSRRRFMVALYRVLFALVGSALVFWTVYLLRGGWNWWVLLTGYLGCGFIINSFFASRIYDAKLIRELSQSIERPEPQSQPTAGASGTSEGKT